jgi:hypothetical protein
VLLAAIESQQAGLALMREILVHMVKNESYQQAVNLLYEVQKTQEDLRRRTEQEKSQLLDKLMEDAGPRGRGERGSGASSRDPRCTH